MRLLLPSQQLDLVPNGVKEPGRASARPVSVLGVGVARGWTRGGPLTGGRLGAAVGSSLLKGGNAIAQFA